MPHVRGTHSPEVRVPKRREEKRIGKEKVHVTQQIWVKPKCAPAKILGVGRVTGCLTGRLF